MTSYTILWTKTYYMLGEFTVEATDEVEAEVQAHRLIGDQQSSLHYIPYEDSIEVHLND
tara:strand:+ start:1343 stop:1519 length:177 start_codon:yes stop_codon:yes gene_type:complete